MPILAFQAFVVWGTAGELEEQAEFNMVQYARLIAQTHTGALNDKTGAFSPGSC